MWMPRCGDGGQSRWHGGTTVGIELEQTLPTCALDRLRLFLLTASDWFEERRPGSFDVSVVAERLGVLDSDREGSRPFAVVVSGSGFGDEETFSGAQRQRLRRLRHRAQEDVADQRSNTSAPKSTPDGLCAGAAQTRPCGARAGPSGGRRATLLYT
jgi:hypothetical protein